jgi:biopolymer transport protein ExbB
MSHFHRVPRGVRWLFAAVFAVACCQPPWATAQQAANQPAPATEAGPVVVDPEEAQRRADAALAEEPAAAPAETPAAPAQRPGGPNLLELQLQGGPLMIPIGFMAIIVVTFGFERWLGLRRRKVLPPALVQELGELAGKKGGLDPRRAYKVCQHHPSAAANIIRATLLKVGRPHSEVEHTVAEASEREAAKLYAHVRPLNLATAIAPLLGLLGTVQGMIQTFAQTAAGVGGANKAEQLAGGIYVALVTTFAGLCVAIPAAVLSHYFEGRIQALFREIDELLLSLLPQLERYEGKLRVSRAAPGEESDKRRETSRLDIDPGERPQAAVASE